MQFLTFGGGDDSELHAAVARLCEQARQFDMFDEIHGLTEVDLQEDPEFWADHGEWIEQCIGVTRGYGFWVWKFYLIGKILGGMPEGHLLLYLDCGCELNVQGKEKMVGYCELAHEHKIIGTSTNSNDLSHTKRDLVHFIYGNLADEETHRLIEEILSKPHMQACILLMENCAQIRELFQHAQLYMKQYHLIDDSSSVAENHPSFVEHRHDQSVLNLLVKQQGLHNHWLDPTYFAPDWNHYGADYPIWAPRNKTGQSIITPPPVRGPVTTWYVQCFGKWQGGLGDFVRSWLCTFAYARLHHPHVTVKLYIPDHPLKHALKCLEGPEEGLETLTLTTHHCNEEQIRETLDTLAAERKSVALISNLRFLECETLASVREEFREQHLHKTAAVNKRLDELRKVISAPGRSADEGFCCIQLRCGDRFMKAGHCNTAVMGIEETEIFRAVESAILFLRDQETRLPIVLISDNDNFKALLSRKYGLITLDTQISHLAVPDNDKVDATLDTVTEFFLLGESRMNVMLAYSGFAVWPSFIYDVPLYEWKNDRIVPFDYVFPY